MRKPSRWKHKTKFKSRKYQGNYERDRSGERVFILRRIDEGAKKHKITFESHELAKDAGWKKIR